jgi:hypothetical protein
MARCYSLSYCSSVRHQPLQTCCKTFNTIPPRIQNIKCPLLSHTHPPTRPPPFHIRIRHRHCKMEHPAPRELELKLLWTRLDTVSPRSTRIRRRHRCRWSGTRRALRSLRGIVDFEKWGRQGFRYGGRACRSCKSYEPSSHWVGYGTASKLLGVVVTAADRLWRRTCIILLN